MQQPALDHILISIIVPIYNVEAFLPQCIDSLLAQTHPNIEIILVDDGSPDRSGQICDRYAAAHANIRVIHKPNGGLSSARNAGIDAAKGAYIGFVDSDDFVSETMFRSLLEAAVLHNAQIVACGRYLTDEEGTVTAQAFTLDRPKFYPTKDAMREILVSGQLDVAAWDKLYLAEVFDGIRFPEGEINEDAAIIFNLLDRASGVVHIGAAMYYYRCRSGSITKSGYKPNKIQALEHAEQIQAFLADRYPELAPCCQQYLAYTCCHQLSLLLKDPVAMNAYRNHYKQYIRHLDRNFVSLLTSPNIRKTWKIQSLLMVFRLYRLVYTLLR